jgi:tetraacyldisaccharide 4'-kinase
VVPIELPEVPTNQESNFEWISQDFNPLVRAWYSNARWPKILAPFSYIFIQLAKFRRNRIQSDLSRQWKPPVPVVVVGNINVGGTGKSPLVMWLTEQFVERGIKVGIVSRGYGGNAESYPLEVTPLSDPFLAGDEAVMLSRRTDCPVVVDPDRVAAAQHLLSEHECDVIISDDGLQHYALDRDVEIVVVDGERGLGNGMCFPAGPLREPPHRLKEVDFVVVNGKQLPRLPASSIRMQMMGRQFVNIIDGTTQPVDAFAEGEAVHAVAGIGNPERFFETLRQLGLNVIPHRFDDHHRYKLAELMFGDSIPVLMTEKDAVKVRSLNPSLVHHNFWYLECDVVMPSTFTTSLLSKLGLNVTPLRVVGK